MECAEKLCSIHPGHVHAGQDRGELSHKGRTRECEGSCELAVGAGPVAWKRRGLTTDSSGLVRKEGGLPLNPGLQGCHREVTVPKHLLGVCVCVCVSVCMCVRERQKQRERIRY